MVKFLRERPEVAQEIEMAIRQQLLPETVEGGDNIVEIVADQPQA